MPSSRGRASTYGRPFVGALYDVDVRLSSRPIWGASVGFQASVLSGLLPADGVVLDIPAGTGLITAKALAGRNHRPLLVAVDLSGQVLRRARRRLGSRAAYVEADVARLPFRDGAFAAVHSSNGFHLFPNTGLAAQELQRVCEPTRRLVVTTWTDRGHRVARWYQRLLARLGHVEQPKAPDHYITAMEAAGLVTDRAEQHGTLLVWTGHKPI